MKHRISIISALCLMGIALLFQVGVAKSEDSFATGTSTPEHIDKVVPVPLKNDAVSQALQLPPGPALSSQAVREVPTISGRYTIGGTTVMPYLGAGFSGGYTSDVDRSVSNGLSTPADSGPRSLFGQSLTPNEFRMGIRIPF